MITYIAVLVLGLVVMGLIEWAKEHSEAIKEEARNQRIRQALKNGFAERQRMVLKPLDDALANTRMLCRLQLTTMSQLEETERMMNGERR